MKQPVITALPTSSLDPAHCPICGGDNRCAMEVERDTGVQQPPCWCVSAMFSAELLARIPADAEGKTCVCPECLARFETERPPHAGGDR